MSIFTRLNPNDPEAFEPDDWRERPDVLGKPAEQNPKPKPKKRKKKNGKKGKR